MVRFTKGTPSAQEAGSRAADVLSVPDYDAETDLNYTTLECTGEIVVGFIDNILFDVEDLIAAVHSQVLISMLSAISDQAAIMISKDLNCSNLQNLNLQDLLKLCETLQKRLKEQMAK